MPFKRNINQYNVAKQKEPLVGEYDSDEGELDPGVSEPSSGYLNYREEAASDTREYGVKENAIYNKVLNSLVFIILGVIVFFTPLFIDIHLLNYYLLSKEYLFLALIFVAIMVFGIRTIVSRSLVIRRSFLDWPLVLLLGLGFVSTLMSSQIKDSFLGRPEYFAMNFIFLLGLVGLYWLVIYSVNTKRMWQTLVVLFIGSGVIAQILFILKIIFHFNWSLFGGAWNVIDNFNSSFGLWTVLVLGLALGYLMLKDTSLVHSFLYGLASLLSVVTLLILGFGIVWWFLLGMLVLLLLIGIIHIYQIRVFWVSVLFVLLVGTIICIIFGSPKSLQSSLPLEVSLGFKPSAVIASKAVLSSVKNFAVGSGLGTFGLDFSLFRTADFNYNQLAWAMRFTQPFSSMVGAISEGGVMLALTLVAILLLVVGFVVQYWLKNKKLNLINLPTFQGAVYLPLLLIFSAWLILTISLFVVFFTVALWIAWFLLTALVVVGLFLAGYQEAVREKNWQLTDTPQYNLIFSFTFILLLTLVVVAMIFGGRFYWAEVIYAKSMVTNDYKIAEGQLQKAVGLRSNLDTYHAALARVYLLHSANLAQGKNANLQEATTYVALAVNEARLAADLSPNSVWLWENLTTMYENASLLVPEAQDWVEKSLRQALSLEPTNPVLYWRLGNNDNLRKNYKSAIDNYKEAIKLKKDYVAAYLGLADAYEKNQQLNEAVEAYKTVFPAILNNNDVLYNFGRLLYNRNEKQDRQDAEKIWQAIVQRQPQHSNALYSLGLLYEGQGDKNAALQYYMKVRDLNPSNKEVVNKISSLVAGQ